MRIKFALCIIFVLLNLLTVGIYSASSFSPDGVVSKKIETKMEEQRIFLDTGHKIIDKVEYSGDTYYIVKYDNILPYASRIEIITSDASFVTDPVISKSVLTQSAWKEASTELSPSDIDTLREILETSKEIYSAVSPIASSTSFVVDKIDWLKEKCVNVPIVGRKCAWDAVKSAYPGISTLDAELRSLDRELNEWEDASERVSNALPNVINGLERVKSGAEIDIELQSDIQESMSAFGALKTKTDEITSKLSGVSNILSTAEISIRSEADTPYIGKFVSEFANSLHDLNNKIKSLRSKSRSFSASLSDQSKKLSNIVNSANARTDELLGLWNARERASLMVYATFAITGTLFLSSFILFRRSKSTIHYYYCAMQCKLKSKINYYYATLREFKSKIGYPELGFLIGLVTSLILVVEIWEKLLAMTSIPEKFITTKWANFVFYSISKLVVLISHSYTVTSNEIYSRLMDIFKDEIAVVGNKVTIVILMVLNLTSIGAVTGKIIKDYKINEKNLFNYINKICLGIVFGNIFLLSPMSIDGFLKVATIFLMMILGILLYLSPFLVFISIFLLIDKKLKIDLSSASEEKIAGIKILVGIIGIICLMISFYILFKFGKLIFFSPKNPPMILEKISHAAVYIVLLLIAYIALDTTGMTRAEKTLSILSMIAVTATIFFTAIVFNQTSIETIVTVVLLVLIGMVLFGWVGTKSALLGIILSPFILILAYAATHNGNPDPDETSILFLRNTVIFTMLFGVLIAGKITSFFLRKLFGISEYLNKGISFGISSAIVGFIFIEIFSTFGIIQIGAGKIPITIPIFPIPLLSFLGYFIAKNVYLNRKHSN